MKLLKITEDDPPKSPPVFTYLSQNLKGKLARRINNIYLFMKYLSPKKLSKFLESRHTTTKNLIKMRSE